MAQVLPAGSQVRALYDFVPTDLASHLAIRAGEILTIVICHGDWYCGTNGAGQTGYFPATYVQYVSPPPAAAEAAPVRIITTGHVQQQTVAKVKLDRTNTRVNYQKRGQDDEDEDEGHTTKSPAAGKKAQFDDDEDEDFEQQFANLSFVSEFNNDYCDWPALDALKDSKFQKAEDKAAEIWKKTDIPVNVNEAQEKLKLLVRKSVPDTYRRKVFLSITGGAESIERNSTMYNEILNKLYPGGKVPSNFRKKDVPLFGGSVPTSLLNLLTEMGKQAFYRLLVVIAKEEPRLEHCPMLSFTVALLLMYMPESEVYHTVMAMIKQSLADCWWFPCTREFYGGFCDAAMTVLEQEDKDSYKLLRNLGVEPEELGDIFLNNYFLNTLPLLTILKVFDVYFNEGTKVLFRILLVVLDWSKKLIKKAKTKEELWPLLNNIEKGSDHEAMFKQAFSYSFSRVAIKARKKEEEKPIDLSAHISTTGVRMNRAHEKRVMKVKIAMEQTVMLDPEDPVSTQLPFICKQFKYVLRQPRHLGLTWSKPGEPFAPEYLSYCLQPQETLRNQNDAAAQNELTIVMRSDTGRAFGDEELDDIWDELNDEDVAAKIIIDDQQRVKAASLNRLIEHITSDAKDPRLLPAVLCTLNSYTTPSIFLQKLFQRYNVPYNEGMGEEQFIAKVQKPIQAKMVAVLNEWIVSHYSDIHPELTPKINAFLQDVMAADGNFELSKLLKLSMSTAGPRQPKLMQNSVPPESVLPKASGRLKLEDVDDFEIARQLSLINFSYLAVIEPKELASGAWGRSEGAAICPNIKKLLLRNRQISGWAACEILKAKKIKDRVKVFSRFVLMAAYLRDQHDFMTCSALLDGINCAAISRLKHTINEIPKEVKRVYDDLERQFSPEHNYSDSRNMFLGAPLPKTPYIETNLTAILNLIRSMPDMHGELINVDKFSKLYEVMSEVFVCQEFTFCYTPQPSVQALLQTLGDPLPDDMAMSQSLAIEPKDALRGRIQ